METHLIPTLTDPWPADLSCPERSIERRAVSHQVARETHEGPELAAAARRSDGAQRGPAESTSISWICQALTF